MQTRGECVVNAGRKLCSITWSLEQTWPDGRKLRNNNQTLLSKYHLQPIHSDGDSIWDNKRKHIKGATEGQT